MSLYSKFGKRFLDVLVAITAMVFLSPVIGAISLFLLIREGLPVFYRQLRPGYRSKPFYLYKFRTMNNKVDAGGQLLPDEIRLTRLGMALRHTSLDELPELYNILKGDMSLVGPRPLLIEYLRLYSPDQARRHDVKPGITGWAQVNGRNAIEWEKKFKYDQWYVGHLSLGLDMKIIGLTLLKVLTREGISYDNHVTMPGFQGTKE